MVAKRQRHDGRQNKQNVQLRHSEQTTHAHTHTPQLNSLTMANLSVMSVADASIRKSFSPNAIVWLFPAATLPYIGRMIAASVQEPPFDRAAPGFLREERLSHRDDGPLGPMGLRFFRNGGDQNKAAPLWCVASTGLLWEQ